MNHHVMMLLLEGVSSAALPCGLIMDFTFSSKLDRIERAESLYGDEAWERALAGMAIGVMLAIAGIIGIVTWCVLA